MSLCEKHLLKSESDLNQYAKLASEGMMLAYPVKVNGKDKRPDIDNIYHSTIKLFDTTKDHAHKAHEIAQRLSLNPPDAKDMQIEPVTLKGRTGYTMHALKLKGPHTQKMQEHSAKFEGMGFPQNRPFEPHITVDKALWDHIKNNNIKNAHEAGIEFGPAELRKGPTVVKTYHHQKDSNEPKVPDHGDFTSKVKAPVTKTERVLGEKPLMKPYVSEAQRRWAHTANGKEALGGNAGVHEWDEATKGKKLPERVSKSETLKTKNASELAHHWYSTAYPGQAPTKDEKEDYKDMVNKHHKGDWKEKHISLNDIEPHHSGHDSSKEFEHEYAQKRKSGSHFPHIIAKPHPTKTGKFVTVDGQHRVNAAKQAGDTHIKAYVPHHEGSLNKSDELQKGALKNVGVALGMAGALAAGSPHTEAGDRAPASVSSFKTTTSSPYNHKKMLNAISQVESSGGKNTNHKPLSNGDSAYGKYALLPNTIKDTIKAFKDLKAQHGKALALTGPTLHKYMTDHKGLEDAIASRHLAHMEHRLGNDPSLISHAWLNGIQGTLNAKNKGEDIKNHWYAKKVKDAYDKEK